MAKLELYPYEVTVRTDEDTVREYLVYAPEESIAANAALDRTRELLDTTVRRLKRDEVGEPLDYDGAFRTTYRYARFVYDYTIDDARPDASSSEAIAYARENLAELVADEGFQAAGTIFYDVEDIEDD